MLKINIMVENNTRLRKEYKIQTSSNNFKCVYGTINRLNPSVIYIKLNTWVKFISDIKEYGENVNKLNMSVKTNIRQEIKKAENFTDLFFYTPNIKKVMTDKNNFFHACFEITLKQKEPIIYEISVLNDKIKTLTDNIIKIIENDINFEFNITKKNI